MLKRLLTGAAMVMACSTVSNGQAPTAAPAQTDLLEILVKKLHISVKEKPPGKKRTSFSVIPVSNTGTGGHHLFVSSFNAAFVIGRKDPTNYSSLYILPYTDFGENVGIGIKGNLWTPMNKWNVPVELRLSRVGQYTYGIGTLSTDNQRVKLNYENIRFAVSANRKVLHTFYGGIGLAYDRFYGIGQSDILQPPGGFSTYPYGTGAASHSTGITFNLLRDNRVNSINPDNGFYASLVLRLNPTFLLNDNQWSSLYLDARKYIPLDPVRRKILAFWGFYWASYGDVPYLNLPSTQMEFGFRSGRGYATSRFRGKEMLYFENEFRFDLTANGLLGGVVFFNVQSMTELNSSAFKYISTGAGFGARIKFNKESNTNIAIDLGVGRDAVEVYIGLGEVF